MLKDGQEPTCTDQASFKNLISPNKSLPMSYLEGDTSATIGTFTLHCDSPLDKKVLSTCSIQTKPVK